MPDKFPKEVRSRIMGSIKARSKLEDRVSKSLWNMGFRFRKNDKSLFGTPDISIKKYHVVIFIDSCFWHACEEHFKMPKSNTEFWANKLERNMNRDRNVSDFYIEKGWNILRIWEHELRKDNFKETVNRIADFINESKKNTSKV